MAIKIEEQEPRLIDTLIFAKDNDLSVSYLAGDSLSIVSSAVNRPGLMLVGYENDFAELRVQIMGRAEQNYLASLSKEERCDRLDRFFGRNIPCVVLTRNAAPDADFLRIAKKHSKTVFVSKKITSELQNDLTRYLGAILAPRTAMSGVMMQINGVGMAITGKSGIGKSETALELLHRGHKLVADDTMDIVREGDRLIARSPEIIRHFMEIRGVGIIDTRAIFGAGSVLESSRIDLVVELENWDDTKSYERVGRTRETTDILGVKVPKLLIPVTAGRNLAVVLEIAASDFNLRKNGHNSARILDKRLSQ